MERSAVVTGEIPSEGEGGVLRLRSYRGAPVPHALASELETIYTESFEARERAPFGALLDEVSSGGATLLVASEICRAVGFAQVTALRASSILLLDYLAVRETARNRGIGGALLEHIRSEMLAADGPDGMLLEVEPPEVLPHDGHKWRNRRIGFYRRHGAELVAGSEGYRMPDMADPTGVGSIPLRLMWLPQRPQTESYARERLHGYITEIFESVYARDANDPLLAAILAHREE